MKKMKPYVIGFVAGAVCMMSTAVIAANSDVTARLFNDAFFKINGTVVATPSDQPILNYNNYSYVPIRFVAEQLGAKVGWDYATKQVSIDYEPKVVEKIVEVEKIVYVDKDDVDDPDTKVYSTLPASKTGVGAKATLENVVAKVNTAYTDAGTRLFVTLENKSDENRIQLVLGNSKLEVDGKSYALNTTAANRDNGWYQDIAPADRNSDDDEYSGYIMFDAIPEDWSKGTLTLEVRTNGSTSTSTDTQTITINFKNS